MALATVELCLYSTRANLWCSEKFSAWEGRSLRVRLTKNRTMPYFVNGAQNAVLALYFCLVFGTRGAKSSVCG